VAPFARQAAHTRSSTSDRKRGRPEFPQELEAAFRTLLGRPTSPRLRIAAGHRRSSALSGHSNGGFALRCWPHPTLTRRAVQSPAVAGVTPAVEIVRYTAGSSLHGVLDGAGVLVERTVSLPGGVSVSIPAAGTGGSGGGSGSGSGGGAGAGEGTAQSWSYPNLHGDNIVLADQNGARQGARASFDPFGQPIDPVTGDIGSSQPSSVSGRRRWRRTIASRPS